MAVWKIAILLLAISGCILAAPKDNKKSLLLPVSSDESKVEVSPPGKSALDEADGEKLKTAESIGLAYYLPYAAPVVKYPLSYYPLYNYYPGYYHSYRNHGFNGYGYNNFGYNVGIYH